MGRRYPALRAISVIYKVLAVIAFLAGLTLGALMTVKGLGGRAALPIGVGIIYALFLWAGAEMILVFLDIEQNTRRAAELLSKRFEGESSNRG